MSSSGHAYTLIMKQEIITQEMLTLNPDLLWFVVTPQNYDRYFFFLCEPEPNVNTNYNLPFWRDTEFLFFFGGRGEISDPNPSVIVDLFFSRDTRFLIPFFFGEQQPAPRRNRKSPFLAGHTICYSLIGEHQPQPNHD